MTYYYAPTRLAGILDGRKRTPCAFPGCSVKTAHRWATFCEAHELYAEPLVADERCTWPGCTDWREDLESSTWTHDGQRIEWHDYSPFCAKHGFGIGLPV